MPPTYKDAQRGKQQVTVERIEKTIEGQDLKDYHEAANALLNDHDSITVIAAALKMLTKERRDTPVQISSVAPVSVKKAKSVDKRRSNNKRYYGGRNQGGRNQSGRNQSGRNRKGKYQNNRSRSK